MIGLILSASTFKAFGNFRPNDVFGPDPYGYRAITSDDTSSLRPVWSWVDKSSNPSTVYLNMSDDEIRGPFSIGFTFPYYWYSVSTFYVHSNGAISFRPNGGFWTPHDNYIPNPSLPNDLIVGLGADLNPSCGGRIYFWTNGVDSLVVTFDSVPTWRQGTNCEGAHTFQIILTSDGNITFNYGPQSGGYDYGIGTVNISVGIESAIGNPGLSIHEDGSPISTRPRDSFAIKIYRPDTTTFRISDASAHSIFTDKTNHVLNAGIFIAYNRETSFVPDVRVENVGTDTLYNTWAKLVIRRKFAGAIVYSDSVLIPVIPPGAVVAQNLRTINFSNFIRDFYTAILSVRNPSDANSLNNTQSVEIRLYHWTNPDTLYWFNWGVLTTGNVLFTRWLSGGGGWAQRFDPRHYPFRIDSAWLVLAGCRSLDPGCTGPLNTPVFIARDTNGTLGTWLYAETVAVSRDSAKIYSLKPPSPITVNGPFFVGYIQVDSLGPMVGVDTSKPYSRQAFESTDGINWAPYRESEASDFVFVVWGRSLESSDLQEKEIPYLDIRITKKEVLLPYPMKISVYAPSGRLVFEDFVDKVSFEKYPRGIYFVKVGDRTLRFINR